MIIKAEHILNHLQSELSQAKKRQRPGATKPSGFMNGVMTAMNIIKQLKEEEINEFDNL